MGRARPSTPRRVQWRPETKPGVHIPDERVVQRGRRGPQRAECGDGARLLLRLGIAPPPPRARADRGLRQEICEVRRVGGEKGLKGGTLPRRVLVRLPLAEHRRVAVPGSRGLAPGRKQDHCRGRERERSSARWCRTELDRRSDHAEPRSAVPGRVDSRSSVFGRRGWPAAREFQGVPQRRAYQTSMFRAGSRPGRQAARSGRSAGARMGPGRARGRDPSSQSRSQ